MPERIEKLRATIGDLEEELSSLTTLDDETRGALEAALQEIQTALHKDDPADALEPHSLVADLKDATERFESSHPTLFGIVSRTIDLLGQAGI